MAEAGIVLLKFIEAGNGLISEETFVTWMSQTSLHGCIHGVFRETSGFQPV